MRWLAAGLYLITHSLVAAPAATPDQARQALDQVTRRIARIQASLAEHRQRESALAARLAETDKRAAALRTELEQLDASLAREQTRLKALRERHREATRALEAQRRRLLDQLRSAWQLGRQAPVKLLLNQTEPASLGRALVYYRYLNQARTERIHAWQESRDRLAELHRSVEASLAELEALRADKRRALERLQAEESRRKRLLASIRETIRGEDARLARLQSDRARLEKLLRSLREALADIRQLDRNYRPLRALRGRLPWPVGGRLRHAFGESRLGGRSRWRGVLIAAPEGRPVRAIHHGRVVFADWLRGFGLLLILDHGDGFMSLYGRNASLYRDVGDWVEAGDRIATVGDTGIGGEPGLYFELRHKGRPLDPVGWLDRRGASRLARGTGEP